MAERVFGVDGCLRGWAVVGINREGRLDPEARLFERLDPLVASGAILSVDIPMGLPAKISGPGRVAEQAVRPLLGQRQSSVFSIPSRAAVYANSYEEACRLAAATSNPLRKVSKQAFQIFAKVREMDGLLDRQNQTRVFETHAELAFWRLNGEEPMPTPKRVKGVPAREGLAERIALLERHGFQNSFFDEPPKHVPLIDLVDAAALALIARRCADGTATPFPDPPGIDENGLRIAIWA
ncbi:MAG: DUF429 domain-containing protein [Pseudomonadota bacterium]